MFSKRAWPDNRQAGQAVVDGVAVGQFAQLRQRLKFRALSATEPFRGGLGREYVRDP
jgi:hypothetical protein